MTKKLNLKSIAEYVENDQILKRIRVVGIDDGQGFYFSRPLSYKDMKQLVNNFDFSEFPPSSANDFKI